MAATKKDTTSQAFDGFTEDERAAMKEHAKEMKASARRSGSKTAQADAEADVLAKIAEMVDSDRVLAERLHAIVKDTAPELAARTYYGMPAYAKDGKNVVFFQPASKFKARYSTLGFNDPAALDDGEMWPTSYAVTTVTPAVEKKVAALVKKSVG